MAGSFGWLSRQLRMVIPRRSMKRAFQRGPGILATQDAVRRDDAAPARCFVLFTVSPHRSGHCTASVMAHSAQGVPFGVRVTDRIHREAAAFEQYWDAAPLEKRKSHVGERFEKSLHDVADVAVSTMS